MADQYDVFLSHSSADKPAVEAIAVRLRDEAGLRVFLDTWHLVPGEPWMPALERAIERSTTVAVFFGPRGRGAWHDQESQLALVMAVEEHGKRVIPVLLPGASKEDVGGFMRLRAWVELGQGDGFGRLVAGVTGRAPGPGVGHPSEPSPMPRPVKPSAKDTGIANGMVSRVPSPPWDPRLRPDVAVLIALPEEFRTIAAEYTRQWYPQRNPDHPGSDFLFVGPGGYRCVATIMPRMGPTVASQTSMRLLAFRPAVIINVGIAGGFKDDLRIGDVIVPRQVDAYDETAKIKGVHWERRGSDYRPSADLLADVLELEFTSHEAHTRWADAGAAQLAELRAGTDQARVDELVQRKLLRDKPTTSTNHLASGSFVVASKPFADFIREANADIHAGEMEAAGMMAAAEYQRRSVSTLVVRGISDHVDADKSEVDAIGEGALRTLAMANAWRLVRTLMELGLLPRTEQANGSAPTRTVGAADPGPTIGWSRARLGMLCAEVPGRATEAPEREPAPLMNTRGLRATSPISEAYFMLQEDRFTVVPHGLSPDHILEGAYNGMLVELGFSQAESAEAVVSGYPALTVSVSKDAVEMKGVIIAVLAGDFAAGYVAIAAGSTEDAGLVSRFVSSVALEGDPPAVWSWNRVDLGQASAEWPAQPRRESSEVPAQVGAIRVTRMSAERPWALFIVEEIKPIEVLVATTAEHRLDRGKDARLAQLTGSVISERQLAFGQHPGRALEVQVHRPLSNHAGIRLFDTGDATYVATVTYETGSERGIQEAERFLSSFRPAGTQ